MAKEPWEETVTEDRSNHTSRQDKKDNLVSTPILTILLSAFLLIIIGIIFFVLYTSNGGSDEKVATSQFSTVTEAKNEETTAQQTDPETTEAETSETTTSSAGETIAVLAGEGPASIAARAGISLDRLYELNPEYMTSGSWYANPGDQVRIN